MRLYTKSTPDADDIMAGSARIYFPNQWVVEQGRVARTGVFKITLFGNVAELILTASAMVNNGAAYGAVIATRVGRSMRIRKGLPLQHRRAEGGKS